MKISWSDFESHTDQLLQKIRQSDYIPDVIVAVGISGLIPAALIAKGLKLQNIEVIIVSSYDENNSKTTPRIILNNLSNFLENKNALVVDDIVASGETFSLVKEQIMSFKPKQIKFCATVVSEFICKKYPDYWWQSIMRDSTDFITFPWDN